jgi:hypothetical protein
MDVHTAICPDTLLVPNSKFQNGKNIKLGGVSLLLANGQHTPGLGLPSVTAGNLYFLPHHDAESLLSLDNEVHRCSAACNHVN